MKLLNSKGTTIYIKLSPETLFRRLEKNKKDRPLINKMTDQQLKIYIQEKLEQRTPYYLQAEHIIEADNYSLNQLSAKIHSLIRAS